MCGRMWDDIIEACSKSTFFKPVEDGTVNDGDFFEVVYNF